jgi:hypothetical protein
MKKSILLAIFAIPFIAAENFAGPPVPDPQYSTRGWWEAPYDIGRAGIHSALLRGADSHSQVLLFASGPDGIVWKFNPEVPIASNAIVPVPTDNSNTFCGGHSMLADGRLLVTGGTEFSDQGLDHVNILDPLSQPLSYNAPRPRNMVESRYYPTSTTLSDGTVLLSGGRKYQEFISFGGEFPAASSGVPVAPRGQAATSGSAGISGVVTNDLVVLGLRKTPVLVNALPSGTRPEARQGHSACFDSLLNDQSPVAYRYNKRTVIFGGRDAADQPLNDLHAIYRDELNAWSWEEITPDPDPVWGYPAPRSGHVAAIIQEDSSMVVFGGLDGDSVALEDVWKIHFYRGANGKWVRLFPTGETSMIARHAATGVYDELNTRLLVFGGRSDDATVMNDVLALSLAGAPSWTRLATTGTPPEARENHVAIFDPTWLRRRMLVYGGNTEDGTPRGDLWQLWLEGSEMSWSLVTPTADPVHGTPSPRGRLAGAVDILMDRWILLGGDTNGSIPGGHSGEVWHLALSNPSGSGSDHSRDPDHAPGARLDRSGDEGPMAAPTPVWKRHYANLLGEGIAGHAAVFDSRWINSSLPELFYPQFDFWQPLYSALKWMQLYPFMFLLPSGKVFYAGPSFFTYFLNLQTGTWEQPPWSLSSFLGGSAVQYLPGKIMKCGEQSVFGGSLTATIDLSTNEDGPWQYGSTSPPMLPRTEHNLTLLPTGEVLLTGGLSLRLDISSAVREPQIWNPVTKQWTPPGLMEPDPLNRDYHSTALLLPDGRIISAGGELRVVPTDLSRNHVTIYWPPYLFDENGELADRPEITGLPPVVSYGSTFLVSTPDPAGISAVNLLRPGAVTHGFNQDQRFVPLEFTREAGGWLRVVAPPDGNIAPVGHYLLFLVDQDSTPSIGSWIEVGGAVTGIPDMVRQVRLTAAPNPFSASTTVQFGLMAPAQVDIEVFDVTGRRVRRLESGVRPAGVHAVTWDGRSDDGIPVANGLYFIRYEGAGGDQSIKVSVRR